MDDWTVIPSFLTRNPCYRAGRRIVVRGLMLHSVGCPHPHPDVFLEDWNREDFDRACVHAFIDAETGDVFQALPWDLRGWHCGGALNNTHVGIEMCEPASLRYRDDFRFDCDDREEAMRQIACTYRVAVSLFARLCLDFDLEPLADGVILSHHEAHLRGLASDHGDPEHLWTGLGAPYTMDGFRRDVRERLDASRSAV